MANLSCNKQKPNQWREQERARAVIQAEYPRRFRDRRVTTVTREHKPVPGRQDAKGISAQIHADAGKHEPVRKGEHGQRAENGCFSERYARSRFVGLHVCRFIRHKNLLRDPRIKAKKNQRKSVKSADNFNLHFSPEWKSFGQAQSQV